MRKSFRCVTHSFTQHSLNIHSLTRSLRQQVDLTRKEGENDAFHVTAGIFCWRDQRHRTAPFIVHTGEKRKYVHHQSCIHELLHCTSFVTKPQNLVHDPIVYTDRWEHVVGLADDTSVVCSTNGSIDLDNFPRMTYHFVKRLPEGLGKGGLPTILIMDGHSSRWSPLVLRYLRENNVHVWVIASHASAWGQVGDVVPPHPHTLIPFTSFYIDLKNKSKVSTTGFEHTFPCTFYPYPSLSPS